MNGGVYPTQVAEWAGHGVDVLIRIYAKCVVGRDELAKRHISEALRGYHPPDGELPRSLAADHRIFVETLAAFEAPPAGCAELSEISPAHAATLGAVIAGRKPGRTTDTEITVYKAMGIGMEDMIAANLAYRSALHAGAGQQLSW